MMEKNPAPDYIIGRLSYLIFVGLYISQYVECRLIQDLLKFSGQPAGLTEVVRQLETPKVAHLRVGSQKIPLEMEDDNPE